MLCCVKSPCVNTIRWSVRSRQANASRIAVGMALKNSRIVVKAPLIREWTTSVVGDTTEASPPSRASALQLSLCESIRRHLKDFQSAPLSPEMFCPVQEETDILDLIPAAPAKLSHNVTLALLCCCDRKIVTILAAMACCARNVLRCAAIKPPADKADFPIRIMAVIFTSRSTAVLKIRSCSSPSCRLLCSLSSFSRVYTSAPPRW